MIFRYTSLILTIALSLPAFAETKAAPEKKAKPAAKRGVAQNPSGPTGPCRALKWKDRRDLTKQQFVSKLSTMSRERIRQMAWGDLLSPGAKPIFPFLFIYLAETESQDLLAGYYEGVLFMMNQSIQWRKVAEQWPQPVDLKQLNFKVWTLQSLCSEYRLAGGN